MLKMTHVNVDLLGKYEKGEREKCAFVYRGTLNERWRRREAKVRWSKVVPAL